MRLRCRTRAHEPVKVEPSEVLSVILSEGERWLTVFCLAQQLGRQHLEHESLSGNDGLHDALGCYICKLPCVLEAQGIAY